MLKKVALHLISSGWRFPQQERLDRLQELVMLKRLLDSLEINCVLDVGANRGQYALELRGIGFTGQIVSFEPIRREFALLQEAFKGDPKWKGYRLALGSAEGSATINIPRLTVLSSLLAPLRDDPEVELEEIEMRRLDRLFADAIRAVPHPKVFLKMDTQGYDVEIFKGAEGCIETICGLQSEISVQPLYKGMPRYLDALRTYEEAGFDLHDLTTVSRIRGGGLQELNCFMVRPSCRTKS
jgi:FkbM family methyltransferase